MNSVLYQLYLGELQPCSTYLERIPGHRKKREQCNLKYHELLDRLEAIDPKLRRGVDDLLDESFRVDREDVPEAFIDGFRLGARIMMEMLAD